MEIVFCTNNQHKIQEVSKIMPTDFHFLKLEDVLFYDDIPEPFDTLEANSAVKASTVFSFCKKKCFAEDTGLFIDGLKGAPGVHSARYAGTPVNSKSNIEKVLMMMDGMTKRSAYFKTVITLLTSKGQWQFEGVCHGEISTQIMGEEGFGYDPIFIPMGQKISFASMNPELKNSMSHRKKAFDKFAYFLKNLNF